MTIDQPATPSTPAEALDPVSASVGRVVGGAILMVLTGALTIVLFAYYIAHDFLPGGDFLSEFGDGLLYGAIFAFVAAVTGLEIMRRGIKRRRAAKSLLETAADKTGATAAAAEREQAAAIQPAAIPTGEAPDAKKPPTDLNL